VSGLLAGKTAIAAASEALVGSSSEVNLPVSINPVKESIVEELDEIMETLNLDLEESSGYSDTSSDDKLGNYLEEDFMTCYGNV
jgi:phosphoserine phosphatase